jgi:hypothetical protein
MAIYIFIDVNFIDQAQGLNLNPVPVVPAVATTAKGRLFRSRS